MTPFEKRVYDAARLIPCGHVTTYKLLASYIGCRCPRAVGQALRRNPFAPRVPCHRVIASDLRIGGFSGRKQGAPVRKKLSLLKKEGVLFSRGLLADPSRIYTYRGA